MCIKAGYAGPPRKATVMPFPPQLPTVIFSMLDNVEPTPRRKSRPASAAVVHKSASPLRDGLRRIRMVTAANIAGVIAFALVMAFAFAG